MYSFSRVSQKFHTRTLGESLKFLYSAWHDSSGRIEASARILPSLHKKLRFLTRISSVNVTKSAVFCAVHKPASLKFFLP